MAAARPIVAAVDADCDTAGMIRKAGCGLVIPPGQGEALAEAILYYHDRPQRRAADGQQGREYFLQNYEKQKIVGKYLEIIRDLKK
jgi:glycosyltransferase involved in cell wall biosynthesis